MELSFPGTKVPWYESSIIRIAVIGMVENGVQFVPMQLCSQYQAAKQIQYLAPHGFSIIRRNKVGISVVK